MAANGSFHRPEARKERGMRAAESLGRAGGAASCLFHAPFPVRAQHASRSAARYARQTRKAAACNALCEASGNGATSTFAHFVPPVAHGIKDESARAMLEALRTTSITPEGRTQPIATVHHVCGDERPDTLPIVLLHGFDSNLLEFRFLSRMLADSHRVHALDILGCGLTAKPAGISYAPRAKRAHLRAFIRRVVGERPVLLLGASLGGAVAIDYALAYPHSVQRLVLVDAQAYQDRKESRLLRAFPQLAGYGAEVLRAQWLRKAAVRMSYVSREFWNDDVVNIGGLHCRTDGWKAAAESFIVEEGYCLSGKVKDVKCPTLVLWGEHDGILPKNDAYRFEREIRHARLHFIPNAGHSPHIEQPQLVADHVLDFASEITASQVAQCSDPVLSP